MDTGDLITTGVAILILFCVTFSVAYNMGYNRGASDVLECQTDMECEMIAHRVGK